MHISDGVLSGPVIGVTTACAAAAIAYGLKETKEEDVPRISLVSATFFAASLLSIKIGPSSVHPLICGLVGIILGPRSALCFFPALLLQALLFQHGGLTTLGANTFMLFIPAIISHLLYKNMPMDNSYIKGGIIGGLSVLMTVVILLAILYFTNPDFASGGASPIRILFLSHLPLVPIEGLITGGAVGFLESLDSNWIASKN